MCEPINSNLVKIISMAIRCIDASMLLNWKKLCLALKGRDVERTFDWPRSNIEQTDQYTNIEQADQYQPKWEFGRPVFDFLSIEARRSEVLQDFSWVFGQPNPIWNPIIFIFAMLIWKVQ